MGDPGCVISSSQPYEVVMFLIPFTDQKTEAQKAQLWSRSHGWSMSRQGRLPVFGTLPSPKSVHVTQDTQTHTHLKSKLWGLLLYYYEVWNLNFPKEYKKKSLSESSLTDKKNY